MSTTTIRLPDEMKLRVAAAAANAGATAHSYILQAIAEKIEQDEFNKDFHDVADQRHANILASGKTIPWADMRKYLEDRAAGKNSPRPPAKKLGR